MSVALPVDSIADTAFLTAFCRAVETERAHALFRDPFARKLAGPRGEAAMQRLPGGAQSASGCIIRTCIVDGLVVQAVNKGDIDTVVNLGAGLDARPYRLTLPSTLCWIEVDQSEVLSYKAKQLEGQRSACNLERMALDITDADGRRLLFERTRTAGRVLILTEGLLIYMRPDLVASLAADLNAKRNVVSWVTDIASRNALRLFRSILGDSKGDGDIKLLFAPEDGAAFFRQFGWDIAASFSCLEEGLRLQRGFVPEAFLGKLSVGERNALRELSSVIKMERVHSNAPCEEPS